MDNQRSGDQLVVPFSRRGVVAVALANTVASIGIELLGSPQMADQPAIFLVLSLGIYFLVALVIAFCLTHLQVWLMDRLRRSDYLSWVLSGMAMALPLTLTFMYFDYYFSAGVWIAVNLAVSAATDLLYRYIAGVRPREGFDISVF